MVQQVPLDPPDPRVRRDRLDPQVQPHQQAQQVPQDLQEPPGAQDLQDRPAQSGSLDRQVRQVWFPAPQVRQAILDLLDLQGRPAAQVTVEPLERQDLRELTRDLRGIQVQLEPRAQSQDRRVQQELRVRKDRRERRRETQVRQDTFRKDLREKTPELLDRRGKQVIPVPQVSRDGFLGEARRDISE